MAEDNTARLDVVLRTVAYLVSLGVGLRGLSHSWDFRELGRRARSAESGASAPWPRGAGKEASYYNHPEGVAAPVCQVPVKP